MTASDFPTLQGAVKAFNLMKLNRTCRPGGVYYSIRTYVYAPFPPSLTNLISQGCACLERLLDRDDKFWSSKKILAKFV